METRKSPVRNQITKTSCNLSQAVYDWSCQHCLARYLVALPNRAMRQLWAQRWEQIYGKETADSIYDLGRRMYLEVSK